MELDQFMGLTTFLVHFRVINPQPWTVQQTGLFHLHNYAPYVANDLTWEEMDRIITYTGVVRDDRHPFVTSQELYLAALRYRKQGFTREAVIFAQSSIESLLATLHDQIRMHEGRTAAEAQQERENLKFIPMVKKKFGHWLGGQWYPHDPKTVCGQWFMHTYTLRNRVVHAGHFPTITETHQALDAANAFIGYVVERIRANRNKYPDIAQYVGDL